MTVGSHIFYRWRGDWGDPKSFRRPYLAAEVAERPRRPERPERRAAAADGNEVVETAFGVTIHRGKAPAEAAREGEGVTVHRSGAMAAVRVHGGAPEEAATDAATPESVPGH